MKQSGALNEGYEVWVVITDNQYVGLACGK